MTEPTREEQIAAIERLISERLALTPKSLLKNLQDLQKTDANRYDDYETIDEYPLLSGPYAEDAASVGLDERLLGRLTRLASNNIGYRIGPCSIARELGVSDKDVEVALERLAAAGKVQVFQHMGQDYWGIR